MVDPDRQARAVFLAPVVQAACASLIEAMDDIGEDASRRALASMVDDPTARIMWEIVNGSRAWDIYQAGGPLQAQHVELTIGPEVSPSPSEVRGMLRTLANCDGAGPAQDAAHLAGLLKRAGIPFGQVASVPAPPVPLAMIADELWNSRGGEQHG